MSTVNITIQGDLKAIKDLNSLQKDIGDFTTPLNDTSEMYMDVISGNFRDQGATFGEKWPPLSPATIAEKKALYSRGQAKEINTPLVRTGALKAGFDYRSTRKNSTIFNTQEYSSLHQTGGTSTFHGKQVTIPRRVLAKVDQKRVVAVRNIFSRWVTTLLKKHNLSPKK